MTGLAAVARGPWKPSGLADFEIAAELARPEATPGRHAALRAEQATRKHERAAARAHAVQAAARERERLAVLLGVPAPAMAAHEPDPIPGSAYRVGPGNCAGTPALLVNPWHYPVEAVCACSVVLCRESRDAEWEHTSRVAGQAPAAEACRVPPGYCPCGKPFSECRCMPPPARQAPAAAEAPSAAAGPVREASTGASRTDGEG